MNTRAVYFAPGMHSPCSSRVSVNDNTVTDSRLSREGRTTPRKKTASTQCWRTFVSVALLFTVVGTASAQSKVPSEHVEIPQDPGSFHLILLAGQSNMAGRGKVDSQNPQTDARILMLNKANEWTLAKDPLHFDKLKVVGVGLGRTFALDYAKAHPGITVGLIPCAVGGSSIAVWEPDGYHSSTKTNPWDDMLPRARLAMKSGSLKAVLWHQGESDSNEMRAPMYEGKLTDLITRLRSQLDADNVPFIAGQMGQFAERPWNEWRQMVDAAHQNLPKTIPVTAFANSTGLKHKGDKVHFNSASLSRIRPSIFRSLANDLGSQT